MLEMQYLCKKILEEEEDIVRILTGFNNKNLKSDNNKRRRLFPQAREMAR